MPTLIARPNAIEMSALAPQWLPGTACAPGSQLTDKFEPDTVGVAMITDTRGLLSSILSPLSRVIQQHNQIR